MADTTEREFWRDLKPIEEVFRPGRGADVYIATPRPTTSATTSRSPRRSAQRPLWISPTQNRWCDILYAKGPAW